jgi:prepilin-type N-terminal cleavage/methylation domain-containing protein
MDINPGSISKRGILDASFWIKPLFLLRVKNKNNDEEGKRVMKKQHILRNQEGFTLVEIIAVLIILGILAAVAVPRYIDLEANAKERAIDAAISELNGRESLTWADHKISTNGYTGDNAICCSGTEKVSYDLGGDYSWTAGPTATGGTIEFKGTTVALNRTPSQTGQPAVWQRP